jgi:hypothetical protein
MRARARRPPSTYPVVRRGPGLPIRRSWPAFHHPTRSCCLDLPRLGATVCVPHHGVRPSGDNGDGQRAESSSSEVSDAEEEEAPPLTTPQGPAAANEEDFDIAVSDTPCTESDSGSGPEEREPQLEADAGTDSDDDPVPERIRHNLWDPESWLGGWRPWFGMDIWELDGALVL